MHDTGMTAGFLVLLLVTLLSSCAPGPAATITSGRHAPDAAVLAVSSEPAWLADRVVTLPSGATLKVAAQWNVAAREDGVTLTDPEKETTIELVDIASAATSDAIASAWARRRPGFARPELAASDTPGREGWDGFRWARYRTSPEEARRVSAYAARRGGLVVVILVEGPLAAVQRRSSEVALVHDSLRPAGYVRETYRGRTPRRLDAPRVAELADFIGRMREAADVPGVSVVLFDRER